METSNNSGSGLSSSIIVCMVLLISCNFGPPENSKAAQAQRGKAHFMKYCSSCHGEDAKGKRIDTLTIQPKDLTTITRQTKAKEFPILEVARMIDGRNMSNAHGTRQMPVWGEVFSTQEHLDEKQIKGKMGEIIAYLMSIQE